MQDYAIKAAGSKSSVVNLSSRAGFFPGLAQPAGRIIFTLPIIKSLNFKWLDDRLLTLFSLEKIPARNVKCQGKKNDVEFAWRILVVAAELAKALRIPIFDPGMILSLSQNDAKKQAKQVTALIPNFQYIPGEAISSAYHHAGRLLQTLVQFPYDDLKLEQSLTNIDQGYVKRYQKVLSGGESTIPLLHAAFSKGIPFHYLGAGVFRLGLGRHCKLIDRSAVESDSAIGSKLAQNKLLSARLMREAGLPAPEHLLASTEQQLLRCAEKLGWPLVVKPLDRDRGEGVTVDIKDKDALLVAFALAQNLSPSVLVERQVAGVCHRLFVANKQKVLFVSKRLPKSVTGDGERSVSELIDEANRVERLKAPWLRLKPFPNDSEAEHQLASVGLTLDSVPLAGQYAPLRRIQSVAEGGVVEDLSEKIHPENIELALRAAQLFNLDSAGVDLITDDVTRPWYENGAILNEVNYASLLGGHVTTYRPKGYLSAFLDMNLQHNGRIPVEVFVGSEKAEKMALNRQKLLYQDGIDCFLTGHVASLRPDGSRLQVKGDTLFQKAMALLTRNDVDYLVILVQTDEFLTSGMPVDRIDALHPVDATLYSSADPEKAVNPARAKQLVSLLSYFTKSKPSRLQ